MDTKETSPPAEPAMSQPHLAPGEVAQDNPPNEPPRIPPLWRNRNFVLLWSGQVVSLVGSNISGITYPLLILALSGSYEAAGWAGALQSIPYILFSLPVGALVDRWNRKLVMVLCDLGRALAIGSIPLSFLFGGPWLPLLYAAIFVEGSLFVFFNLAETAALPRVVSKSQLPEATGINQAAQASAGMVGPGIGTFLYAGIGKAVPFLLDAVSYLLSAVALLFVKIDFQGERGGKERHLGREIKEGIAWLWNEPVVRFMSFLTGSINFVSAGVYLVVIARAKEIGADDSVIGVIFAIGAAGGVLGSIIGGRIGKRLPLGPTLIGVVWIQVLVLPFFGIAPNIWLLGIFFGVSYLTIPIYNVVGLSYRVSLIPDELQGRVNSVARLIAFGFQPLGAAAAGFLLQGYGAGISAGVLAAWLLLFSIVATLNSNLRNARQTAEDRA